MTLSVRWHVACDSNQIKSVMNLTAYSKRSPVFFSFKFRMMSRKFNSCSKFITDTLAIIFYFSSMRSKLPVTLEIIRSIKFSLKWFFFASNIRIEWKVLMRLNFLKKFNKQSYILSLYFCFCFCAMNNLTNDFLYIPLIIFIQHSSSSIKIF